MAIFKTAYDTVAGKGYRLQELEDKLKAGRFTHAFHTQTLTLKNYEQAFQLALIEGGNTASDIVPYFSHPVLLRDSNDKSWMAYVDMRNFGKWYAPQAQFVIRNHPEYVWHYLRAVLNQLWVQERPEQFRDLSSLPAQVYSALISESVARKYALDPAEQLTIQVLAAYFYYGLFTEQTQYHELDYNKLVGKLAQLTRVPANKVYEILDEMPILGGLEALCEAIKQKTGSVRLQEFNVGVLLAIVSGNWAGTNARENLAVALEHVPTWLMICYASLTETSFKRSVLAKLVERFAKGTVGTGFSRGLDMLLDRSVLLRD